LGEDEELEMILSFRRMLRALTNPIRWRMFRLLRGCGEPMSFTQIKQYLMGEGREYNDGQLWNHLRILIDNGLLKEEKVIIKRATGRTVTSLYTATEAGVMVVDYLKMLGEKIDEFLEKQVKG